MATKKFFLAVILTFSILTLGGGRAWATTSSLCKPDETIFTKIARAFKSLDIRKTVQNMIATALTDGIMNLIANRNPQQMTECAYDSLVQAGATNLVSQVDSACNEPIVVTEDCSDFTKTYDANSLNSGLAFRSYQSGGSLLGIANTLDGANRTEPLPVNLAYYWNDQIKNMPLASQALAANVNYGNAYAIYTILELWKTFRNIAFGILSIVMLVTGVMIMTRKKLSPQLSVTAQYALPRIALAVVLIVFSYPIGAVLASSMRYLATLGERIVCNSPFPNPGIACPAPIGLMLGSFLMIALISIVATGGIATPLLVVLAVVMLIVLVLNIGIQIRGALLYMKLILSIVFAPIVFALGAIPGNEPHTTDYLKQWLAYVLGYVGMFVFSATVNIICLLLILGPSNTFTLGTATAAVFTVLFSPVILIFGYIQALKIPGKVKDFIMGERNPRQKKR